MTKLVDFLLGTSGRSD